MVFPCQGDRAVSAAHVGEGVDQVLDHRAAWSYSSSRGQDPAAVIGKAPLAGILVDDRAPSGRDRRCRRTGCRSPRAPSGRRSSGRASVLQGGGGIGPGAPDGIVGIVADEAVLGEDVAFAAFHPGRAVGDGDGLSGNGRRSRFRRARRRLFGGAVWASSGGSEQGHAQIKRCFMRCLLRADPL